MTIIKVCSQAAVGALGMTKSSKLGHIHVRKLEMSFSFHQAQIRTSSEEGPRRSSLWDSFPFSNNRCTVLMLIGCLLGVWSASSAGWNLELDVILSLTLAALTL